MATYYHGSNREIKQLETGVMFFTDDEDFAGDFADSNANYEQRVCHLYKIDLPDNLDMELISDFELFDCAYINVDLIKGDGWICAENNWICLKNPERFNDVFTLVTTWEAASVLDKEKFGHL